MSPEVLAAAAGSVGKEVLIEEAASRLVLEGWAQWC